MKRIIYFLILLSLFVLNVKAETVLDDYKLEIVIDKDDVFKVKESFKVLETDSSEYFRFKNSNSYSYQTDLENFDNDYR